MMRSKTTKFVYFGTLTEDELLAWSVCEIIRPAPRGGATKSKDRVGTPYDDRLGPLENGFKCGTCREKNKVCVGHFGHIVLPTPIYNKMFLDYIYKILMCVCEKCASPRLPQSHAEMQNLIRMKGRKRLNAFAKRCKKIVICPNCDEPLSTFKKDQNKEGIYYYAKNKETGESMLYPFDAGNARNVFLRMSNETMDLLGFNHSLPQGEDYTNKAHIVGEKKTHVHQVRPESFIWTILPVLPSTSRPYVVRDGDRGDDDLTDKYNSIIKLCNKIKSDRTHGEGEIPKGRRRKKLNVAQLQKAHTDLKTHIWTLMNNKDEKSRLSSGGRAHKCLRQRIRGKEGRIQTNIGGKRTDFSARSVIVPAGITLKDDELGVPNCVADELTRAEKVKAWNYEYLQSLVDNGHANRVIRNGQIKRLDVFFEQTGKRHFPLQINDDVERKTMNGDTVLFNRQPTLRPESMVAYKAKRIDGFAFRLQLSQTAGFNADFDGRHLSLVYFFMH